MRLRYLFIRVTTVLLSRIPQNVARLLLPLLVLAPHLLEEGFHQEEHHHACLSEQGHHYYVANADSGSLRGFGLYPIEIGDVHQHDLCAICQLVPLGFKNQTALVTPTMSAPSDQASWIADPRVGHRHAPRSRAPPC